jgi:predicted AlkP superfamily phosphohydrolase/phosphomutase
LGICSKTALKNIFFYCWRSALCDFMTRSKKVARSTLVPLVVIAGCLVTTNSAHAYIGPGAGFAFLGSTLVFVVTIGMALLTLLFWPLQWAWRRIRRKGIAKNARTRRVVVVGLDGLEPSLVEKYMAEGILPHMSALQSAGSFARLGTTLPALSPVAWSSFQTGVNPGAHNIFDFLTRDKRYCLPQLASTETLTNERTRSLLGFRWKKAQSSVAITRKSQPFWKILGAHGVFSNIIRVPISYPPEKFNGNILSAMCTPDLRGTQGSFSFFTERSQRESGVIGGETRVFEERDGALRGALAGPPSPDGSGPMTIPFALRVDRENLRAALTIDGKSVALTHEQFSPWVELTFSHGRVSVVGIARFCLRSVSGGIALYISPINIHPEKPALPISEPAIFSSWLAKKHGLFGTLGLMEDTWGRNELALDDARFLEQTYLTHAERERMFFEALAKTREGLCVCVFDASDRIQHMFWRYLDEQHPSPREDQAQFGSTIRDMYIRMDQLVGKTTAELNPGDHLFVVSDHGFASFRRCINLNTWLHREGYLCLKDGKTTSADYFRDVDWSRTKAFAVGLSGIYLNRIGREVRGIVSDAEASQLKREISQKLQLLRDPSDDTPAIRRVHDSSSSYRGLYAEEAPDLIVGYYPGYRVSWDSITGTVEAEIFSDNLKAWSGDHHVDPELIPGIIFSNQPLTKSAPHITDIAPTILSLFAVKPPPYMEGEVIV